MHNMCAVGFDDDRHSHHHRHHSFTVVLCAFKVSFSHFLVCSVGLTLSSLFQVE